MSGSADHLDDVAPSPSPKRRPMMRRWMMGRLVVALLSATLLSAVIVRASLATASGQSPATGPTDSRTGVCRIGESDL